jgi:hypothetical protein
MAGERVVRRAGPGCTAGACRPLPRCASADCIASRCATHAADLGKWLRCARCSCCQHVGRRQPISPHAPHLERERAVAMVSLSLAAVPLTRIAGTALTKPAEVHPARNGRNPFGPSMWFLIRSSRMQRKRCKHRRGCGEPNWQARMRVGCLPCWPVRWQ